MEDNVLTVCLSRKRGKRGLKIVTTIPTLSTINAISYVGINIETEPLDPSLFLCYKNF